MREEKQLSCGNLSAILTITFLFNLVPIIIFLYECLLEWVWMFLGYGCLFMQKDLVNFDEILYKYSFNAKSALILNQHLIALI